MNGPSLVGAAWQEAVKGAPERSVYRVSLPCSIFGQIVCRVVENPKREGEKFPTHLMFQSPFEGEDVKVGAFWARVSPSTGSEYLGGEIDPAAFAVAELRGGAQVDGRRMAGPVRVRLSRNANRASDRSPTHLLWIMKPTRRKGEVAAAAESAVVPGEGDSDPEASEEEVTEEAES